MTEMRERLRTAILTLTAERAPRSICPSEAARAVDPTHWRDLMDTTRDVARELSRSGDVVVTQKGGVLDPDAAWRGPVRLRSQI